MGIIEPRRRVNVGAQVSGVVKELYVDFNSVVTEGQLLAEIESDMYEVQVQVQEANVARQKLDIETQGTQLADLKRQLARVKELFAKDLQNRVQLDAAELAVTMREAQITSAKKQLVQGEAALSAARLNLSYTKIYSPIDGVVVNRSVDKGQTVQASLGRRTSSCWRRRSSLTPHGWRRRGRHQSRATESREVQGRDLWPVTLRRCGRYRAPQCQPHQRGRHISRLDPGRERRPETASGYDRDRLYRSFQRD
jgi:multidrug efflux pump subunit AcrA (membrane-fusion protein)